MESIWVFTLAIGIATIALIWAASMTITAMVSPLRRRLKALRGEGEVAVEGANGPALRGVASDLWRLFEPSKETERAGLQLRLLQAGFYGPSAIGVVYAAKLVCAVLLPAGVIVLVSMWPKAHVPVLGWAAIGLGAAFVGSLIPDLFLARRFEARKERLMEGLPDALDLLVTCTEAGLGLNAALERVVEQLPASHPDLAHELGMVNAEVRAGIDRNVALKNLGERAGLEEIHGLVSLITHSSRLGTGIAGTLRIYAEDFRDRRMQRAEELGATVGTKLIFPLVLFLFPAFFVVAVGPAILGVLRVLSGVS